MSDKISDEASNSHFPAPQRGYDDIAEELRLAITRTSRALRQEAGGSLTPTALSALASISRHQPLTPAALAGIESVRRPTVTRVVAHLVDSGMVARRADPGDRRSFSLTLTDAGSRYLEERRSRKSAYLSRLLGDLGPEDVAVLRRAAEILDRARIDGREQSAGPES
jgi:DNA-binding MarR family transcriptional regulator